MNNETRDMLTDAYERTLREIQLDYSSVDDAKMKKLSEFHRQLLEDEKAKNERELRYRELNIKEAQIEDNKKDRIVKIVLEGSATVLTFVGTCYWMSKGLKFEQTGSFTSKAGQWVGSFFRLFKK